MEKAKRFYNGALSKERTERENKNACLARKLAADGIVLLKNDDRVLPLDITKPVALFGSGADKTIKGGTGSGDVNNRYNISIYTGLNFCLVQSWIYLIRMVCLICGVMQ